MNRPPPPPPEPMLKQTAIGAGMLYVTWILAGIFGRGEMKPPPKKPK